MQVPVYDILNCGPRHRFVANGKLVHNSDKINLQNLPSRGPNAYKLKKTITAPEGYLLIACDASQIEARILAWLAGQEDLVESFARDEDVYKEMATRIYNKDIADVDKSERFVGKTTILGCGYQMGAERFREQSQVLGIDLTPSEAKRIVSIYRETNPRIKQLWADAQLMIRNMVNGRSTPFGKGGIIQVDGIERTLTLPTGVKIRYDDLQAQETEKGLQFSYKTRRGRKSIYGGKVIENVCQAIARCIMAEQMVRIDKRYRVAFTVHDEVTVVVPENEIDEAVNFVGENMLYVPEWAEGVPLACEAGYAKTYGDCGDIEIKFTRADR